MSTHHVHRIMLIAVVTLMAAFAGTERPAAPVAVTLAVTAVVLAVVRLRRSRVAAAADRRVERGGPARCTGMLAVEFEDDGGFTVPGAFPVDLLAAVGADLPVGDDYATVAGLVLDRLGRIPEFPGDIVVVDGWELEVAAVDARAITSVRLRPLRRRAPRPAGASSLNGVLR